MHQRHEQMIKDANKPVELGKGSVKFNEMATRKQLGKAGYKPDLKAD